MGCDTSYPPSRFDSAKLRKWVDENKLHLIECESCESALVKGPPVQCNLCKEKKGRSAFAVARRQSNELKKWRCKECDYAPCQECGKIPVKALHVPGRTESKWTCQVCLYPPCVGCGRARPKKQHLQKHIMPVYCCSICKRKDLEQKRKK